MVRHGNKSVCSKMGAKHPHAVQKELNSFFGFSQSGSKKVLQWGLSQGDSECADSGDFYSDPEYD